jgi:hypothetical protein
LQRAAEAWAKGGETGGAGDKIAAVDQAVERHLPSLIQEVVSLAIALRGDRLPA